MLERKLVEILVEMEINVILLTNKRNKNKCHANTSVNVDSFCIGGFWYL